MKHIFLAAALIIASSIAFADATSDLLDEDKVRSMSAEEYAAAVRSAPDVNVRDTTGRTPLHLAAKFGTPANIAALVSAGADVEARSGVLKWTPLHDATTPANIAALVSAGADVEARGVLETTPLHFAAGGGTSDNIAALVRAGADVEARNIDGRTPLHFAAFSGTPANIAALLEAGASGSVKDKNGKTPFDLAGGNDKVKGTSAYRALNDAQYK